MSPPPHSDPSEADEDAAPLVSVVMPVRNAMPYLDEAIASVLGQTLDGLELVIGDDASDDGSSACLERWALRDHRIRVARRDRPSGPAGSSNWVVEMARSEFVARMDADDLILPHRLERQLAVMHARPDVVLVGSLWTGIDAGGRTIRDPDVGELLRSGPLRYPFAHGSTMMRKSAFTRAGGYREACDYWEDADLFHRLGKTGQIVVLTEPLYRHRFATTSNRLTASRAQVARQHALQIACADALEERGDYENLLISRPSDHAPLPLGVYRKRAAMSVRAGHRSDALHDWFALEPSRRGRTSAMAFAFLVWSAIAPKSLRWALGRLVAIRNRFVPANVRSASLVEWTCYSQSDRPARAAGRVAEVGEGRRGSASA